MLSIISEFSIVVCPHILSKWLYNNSLVTFGFTNANDATTSNPSDNVKRFYERFILSPYNAARRTSLRAKIRNPAQKQIIAACAQLDFP